jgi:hypothetical protein
MQSVLPVVQKLKTQTILCIATSMQTAGNVMRVHNSTWTLYQAVSTYVYH